MSDIMIIDVVEQLKPFLNDKNFIEIVIRGKNKKFKAFQKIALDKVVNNQEQQKEIVQKMINALNEQNEVNVKNMNAFENAAKLDQLNLLMNGLNLCATCIGFAIVCKKLNEMNKEITEVLSVIKTTNDLHLDLEFNKCISEHEKMLDHRKTQNYFSYDRMENLVASEYNTLRTLINHFLSETINNKEVLLYSIMTLSSMFATSLKYFDEMYYMEYKDRINTGDFWHTSHEKWTDELDRIASNEFVTKLQDYGFLELGLSTSGCDAFYINVKDNALGYKQEIIDNQYLLEKLNSKEMLDQVNDYYNQEVRNSIINIMEQDCNIKADEEIKVIINQCMQQVGIMN